MKRSALQLLRVRGRGHSLPSAAALSNRSAWRGAGPWASARPGPHGNPTPRLVGPPACIGRSSSSDFKKGISPFAGVGLGGLPVPCIAIAVRTRRPCRRCLALALRVRSPLLHSQSVVQYDSERVHFLLRQVAPSERCTVFRRSFLMNASVKTMKPFTVLKHLDKECNSGAPQSGLTYSSSVNGLLASSSNRKCGCKLEQLKGDCISFAYRNSDIDL